MPECNDVDLWPQLVGRSAIHFALLTTDRVNAIEIAAAPAMDTENAANRLKLTRIELELASTRGSELVIQHRHMMPAAGKLGGL